MKNLLVFIALASLGTLAAAQNYHVDLPWVTHLQAQMLEQDVFVEMDDSGMVYRVSTETMDMYMDAPVFTTATATKHDPFNPEATGPFAKGSSLDLTLAQWLQGSGTLNLSCNEGQGSLEASFTKLVPNGVYTFWHFYTPMPPTVPLSVIELPLGARDGSENTFVADANGDALFRLELDTCLPLSTPQLLSALSIAYHSDGKTYGMGAGEFGSVSHVQLFSMFPTAEDAMASN